jgi:hypothetical protein
MELTRDYAERVYAGAFTFLRSLEDHWTRPDLSPREVGESWLNYIIRERTILWWGGMGNSTEHTAYLRLASGIAAPESGSVARNGKVVSEGRVEIDRVQVSWL